MLIFVYKSESAQQAKKFSIFLFFRQISLILGQLSISKMFACHGHSGGEGETLDTEGGGGGGDFGKFHLEGDPPIPPIWKTL